MKPVGILLITVGIAIAAAMAHPDDRPLIIAHRGASHDAPENTLAAFRLAWQQNADGIEGDYYLTKDERIVCMHDDTTKRTAGVDLRIADSTLEQLQKLDIGSWKDERWAGERIPTIEQVLGVVPKGKKIYVEVKCGPEILPPLKRAITESGLTNQQVVIISFREPVIAEAKRILPELKAIWLVAYHKNEDTGVWSPSIDEIVSTLQRSKADGVGTEANREVVTADFSHKLRQGGFEFHVWTVDDVDKARYFNSLGVDSIITNRPAFLRERLQSRRKAAQS